MLKVDIVRIDLLNGKKSHERDCVAQEKPLHIFLNRAHYATVFCSPSNLEELAVGHLISEGVLESMEEIKKISLGEDVCRITLIDSVDAEKRLRFSKHFQRFVLPTCGGKGSNSPSRDLCKVQSQLRVQAETILHCVNRLNQDAEIFRRTGGAHAAAIFKADGMRLAFAEDIGRHNAVDKVIGMVLMQRIDLRECLLALTGRLTADIVMKSMKVSVPVVASIAAAVDSGIAIARQTNLTLIGFARGKRMNIYSCPERIRL